MIRNATRIRTMSVVMGLASTWQAGSVRALETAEAVKLEEVVITGSLIQGAVEDTALPVDVISTDDLRRMGAPNNTELVKMLPYVNGVTGDNNRTQTLRTSASNFNLRGLSTGGGDRTLVLFNGQRIAPLRTGTGATVDLNGLPMAAVGRIEILKDGGATTYGSDAIAGVVNIISKRDLNGIEAGVDYSAIRSSDGDLSTYLNYGKVSDAGNFLASISYTHRSQLRALDRGWAVRPYLENPAGYDTAGNPGAYSVRNAPATTSQRFLDPGCELLGGLRTPLNSPAGATSSPTCVTSQAIFQNIVDESDRGQVFVEWNHKLSDALGFHINAFGNITDNLNSAAAPGNRTPAQFPSTATSGGASAGLLANQYFIPANNPGLNDLLNTYSAAQLGLTTAQYNLARTNGVNAAANWRLMGLGGNPAYGNGPLQESIRYRGFRISTGLDGSFAEGALKWNSNVTYGLYKSIIGSPDFWVQRVELALRGLGGYNCTGTTPGANGCQFYNPFSTGFAANGATGVANPGYVGNANDPELVKWMSAPNIQTAWSRLATIDAGLSGKLAGISLPGGDIAWAAGAQYRWIGYADQPSDDANIEINPCTDAGQPASSCPGNGVAGAPPRGALLFNAGSDPTEWTQNAKAGFFEFQLPVFDSLNIQLAGRYESTPAGSTTDPKIAVRWQALDWAALRLAYETTFRIPVGSQTDPNEVSITSGTFNGTRRLTRQSGNADLKPESARNFDVGIIFSPGNLRTSIDYWRYEVNNILFQRSASNLYAILFPNPAVQPLGLCGDPSVAEVQASFEFANGVCSDANILAINGKWDNGAGLVYDGIDLDAQYTFDSVLSGRLTLGAAASRILKYKVETQFFPGSSTVISRGYDGVGSLNVGVSNGRPLPRLRVTANANYSIGDHNVRWVVRYVAGMKDNRIGDDANTSRIDLQINGFPTGTVANTGGHIPSTTLHDLAYVYKWSAATTINFAIQNVFDKDPAFARFDLNYDGYTGSPLGRVFKLGVVQNW